MTVLLIAAATAEIKRLQMILRRPQPPKMIQPSNTQPRICAPAASVMTRPALNIFFRSISRPIMNSSSDRPISEMVWIESALVIHWKPCGPMAKPADQIRQQQRLPRHLRHHRHDPRGDDADGDVGDKAVFHAGKLIRTSRRRNHEMQAARGMRGPQVFDKIQTRRHSAAPPPPNFFGLRREAKRHAAFARTNVARTNLDGLALESGVAAALCHRSPKSSPPTTKLEMALQGTWRNTEKFSCQLRVLCVSAFRFFVNESDKRGGKKPAIFIQLAATRLKSFVAYFYIRPTRCGLIPLENNRARLGQEDLIVGPDIFRLSVRP